MKLSSCNEVEMFGCQIKAAQRLPFLKKKKKKKIEEEIS
jgi:hypothetical protein